PSHPKRRKAARVTPTERHAQTAAAPGEAPETGPVATTARASRRPLRTSVVGDTGRSPWAAKHGQGASRPAARLASTAPVKRASTAMAAKAGAALPGRATRATARPASTGGRSRATTRGAGTPKTARLPG